MQDFKQLGVGLAVAVLIDVAIVRVVLLLAVRTLLGRRNWYLPRWLNRLCRISCAEGPPQLPLEAGRNTLLPTP